MGPYRLAEAIARIVRQVSTRGRAVDANRTCGIVVLVADSKLSEISKKTLAHYDGSAREFWEGTCDHDVSQNIDALLEAIPGEGPFRVLDFGCGPGRDLIAFCKRGHRPVGLDGAAAFVRMARELAGVEVWEQDFLALNLPAADFDGVFANATLFHVPSRALPRVLGELFGCLRPGGVFFASNPRGDNEEGWNRGRYGAYHDLEHWRAFATGAGFEEIRHYYRPDGLPRAQQPWLASLWRRPSNR
jgi:SAM-dependent methyltransferase